MKERRASHPAGTVQHVLHVHISFCEVQLEYFCSPKIFQMVVHSLLTIHSGQ